MSCYGNVDPDCPEINNLSDLKTISFKRSSRKGFITRAEKFLALTKESPTNHVNIKEFEKRLEELVRHLQHYEALQNRFEFVADEQEYTIPPADIEAAECVRLAHEELLTSFRSHLLKCQLHRQGITLENELEDYESIESLSGCLAELQLLRTKVDEFVESSVPFSDGELPAVASNLRRKTRCLLAKARDQAVTPAPTTTVSIPSPVNTAPKLKPPTFSGKILDWPAFWNLFAGFLKDNPGLTPSQKTRYLVDCMEESETKRLVTESAGSSLDYEPAIVALRDRFEQKRAIFASHYSSWSFTKTIAHKHKDISNIIMQTKADLRGFESCDGCSVQHLTVANLERRFDDRLRQRWIEHSRKLKNPPSLDYMLEFLNELLPGLLIEEKQPSKSHPPVYMSKPQLNNKHKASVLRAEDVRISNCPVCKRPSHPLYLCETFKSWDQQSRHDFVRTSKLCYNCLANSHSTRDCTSFKTCKTCGRKHHSLLHRLPQQNSNAITITPPTSANSIASTMPAVPIDSQTVTRVQQNVPASLLSTALVRVSHGRDMKIVRALLDPGATVSLVSSRVVKDLKLPKTPHRIILSANWEDGNFDDNIVARCHVIDSLLPSAGCQDAARIKSLPLIRDKTPLADPGFGSSSRLDILLGVGDVARASRDSRIRSADRSIQLDLTIFGWTVSGQLPTTSSEAVVMRVSERTTDKLLENLWQREETPKEQAKIHYLDSYKRREDGRYSVSLPRVIPTPPLGNSKATALQRFLNNERSLRRKGKLEEFNAVLQEYEDLSHAEPVPVTDLSKPDRITYYLPMHGVVKESSSTTKLRIVFDASAKSSTGISLNDTLLPTPSLYPLLSTVLSKFRRHRVALSADISKMFREVLLDEQEKDFHRFLRRSTGGEIEEWRMCRLTFGVSSSPFLASQILRQVAEDHQSEFPEAAEIIKTTFYVDDCLTGAESTEQAIRLQQQLYQMLQKAGMNLRKWRSNNSDVLSSIPTELLEKENKNLLLTEPSQAIKTLGVHWNTIDDTFYISVPVIPDSSSTKRIVASAVAKVYDVLGWFAPATLYVKILLQQLWQCHLTWDEPIPEPLETKWKRWKLELPLLGKHPISRRLDLSSSPPREVQLHGFSDASQKAYGGAVYIRILHEDTTVSVTLVSAKTRVAPIKTLSIPRLELCGAVILSNLLKITAEDLQISHSHLFAWTDSTVVLGWLSKPSVRWKTFVANRIAEIQDIIPALKWRHIPTADNPADHSSRGLTPSELLSSKLWWKGPSWLLLSPDHWPNTPILSITNLPEERPPICNITVEDSPETIWSKFSSFKHLIRIIAWCQRFITRIRQKPDERTMIECGLLTSEELDKARSLILRLSQQQSFPGVHQILRNRNSLSKKHVLCKLHPYLDEAGILRVGGRLLRTDLPADVKHPIILHGSSRPVKLLCNEIHKNSKHPGPNTMLAILSENFYILGIRKLLKKQSRICVPCQKAYARTNHQLMGQLPPDRVAPVSPFTSIGVDFAGPFLTVRGNPRKPTLVKAYVSLFICLSTKAVHLELCPDLSTEAFLMTFRRFIARRGIPTTVTSDNGKNFTGAARELSEIAELFQSKKFQQGISHFSTEYQLQWNFIPARSPHFGGLWETGIRSMKMLMKKIIGTHRLTYIQLETVIIEIEATLNSRPLLPIQTSDPDGPSLLTPGRFLIGRPIRAMPTKVNTKTQLSSLRHWNLTKRLVAELWRAWHRIYLQSLQARNKWITPTRNFVVGGVVLLKDVSLTERTWPLGVVIAVYPGIDARVRVVDVKVRGKVYRRSTDRLVLLVPEQEPQDSGARGEDGQDREIFNAENAVEL